MEWRSRTRPDTSTSTPWSSPPTPPKHWFDGGPTPAEVEALGGIPYSVNHTCSIATRPSCRRAAPPGVLELPAAGLRCPPGQVLVSYDLTRLQRLN